jgi:hypothetical protein
MAAYAQPNIVKAEFFADTDPGIGAATDVPVTAAPTLTNITFDRSLTSVADGLHKLYVRVRDANGLWSTTESTPFFRWTFTPTTPPAAVDLTNAEYFIDTDPGVGNGTAVTITPGLSVTNLSVNIGISSISDGNHKLYVRFRDANGLWTTTEQTIFYKMTFSTTPPAAAVNLTNAEYFVDTDPGAGNGTAIAITPGLAVTDLLVPVNVNTLTEGNHKLFVRFKDVNGLWSVSQTSNFSVCNQAIPVASAATAVTTTGFTANWAAASGANSYVVDVSTDNFAIFVTGYNAKSITGTTTAVTGLSAGVAYAYRVSAVNATCTSVRSSAVNVSTVFTTPTASAATAITSSGFTANWAAVTGATGYQLDISTDNFSTFISGYNSKSVTATSEVVTGLAATTAYQYRVRATNGVSVSANSTSITATTAVAIPAAPAASAASLVSATGFTANWGSVVSATGYLLDVSADNFATFISGYNARIVSGLTQAVTGLTANTAYKYRVRATNAAGASANSNIVDVTTLVVAPVASAATVTTTSDFVANWAAVTGATSYQLDVSTDNFTTFVAGYNSKAVTGTSETVSGLTASTAYKYRVRALSAAGASVNSNTIDITTKQSQTITFAALAAKTFGDAAFTLSASASSGLAVSYASSNTAVATVSGNTVSIIGAGTSTITASQAGNNTFGVATSITQTLTVNKANQSVTFAALPAKLVTDPAFALSATGGASGLPVIFVSSNTAVATISGSTVTIVGAGTTTITASQAGNANYNAAADVTQTLTVSPKQSQTITFATLAARTFGDAAFTLAATASSQLAVSYASSNAAVATVSGNTVTIVGVGTTTITASQAGNNAFDAATNVTQTLTVNKANQTITFAALLAKSVTDAAFTLSASGGASGLPVTFVSSNTAVATISGSTVTIIGAGSTNITASQAGNANYNAAADVTQTLTVNAKPSQTITFAALPAKTFGDAAFTLSASSSSQLAVSFASSNTAVATISGNTVTIVGAGTTIITASQAGNDTFNPASNVTQTLTVNKANQVITFAALPAKLVTDAAFTLSASGGASGLPVTFVSSNTAVATISGNTVTIVGAGITNIIASQAGNANYNSAADVTQTLTVNPKQSQTITFATLAARTFGDAAFTLAATASSQLAVSYASSNTAVATVSGNTVTIVGAGTTAITASQSGNNVFEAATNATQTLTVNKASQTITFAALLAKSVTDAAFTLSASGGASGLPVTFVSSNTAVATISGSTVTIIGAGSTNITASQAGNANYNAAADVTQILTVNAKQSQTITFAALPAKTFGDAAFTLSASASSQLAVSYASSNTAVATVSGNTITIVGAGTTTITASQAGNDAFAAASNVTQTLIVNKAGQTITFAALPAKILGSAAFSITATGGASGLPVTFASSNSSVATISGSTVTIVAAGTTNITASQAGTANYNAAADVVQPLTVTAKQNQTITFAALADKTLGETAFALTATASSGLAVAFSTTSDKITLSGSQVTLVKAGRASIVANQAGNDAFNAATAVTQSFCIKPAKPTVTLSNNNTETVTLNSSATTGNQWYLAGNAIAGATNATLAVTTPGVYKVQVKVDDCTSEFSADQTILVTGDIKLDASSISISPNPVDDLLQLNGIVGEIKSSHLFDVTGRVAAPLILEKKNDVYQASVEHLTQGVYVLRVVQENKVVQIKFIKK